VRDDSHVSNLVPANSVVKARQSPSERASVRLKPSERASARLEPLSASALVVHQLAQLLYGEL